MYMYVHMRTKYDPMQLLLPPGHRMARADTLLAPASFLYVTWEFPPFYQTVLVSDSL